jgi:HSP20 family molecular chaperone IbpA
MIKKEKPTMANEKTHEVQTVQQDETGTAVEQTRPGPVYVPAVDIFEQDERITLLADMPGVEAGDLRIDLHDNVLTMTGDVADPEVEGEADVFREYRCGRFYRQFTLSDKVDQAKIEASLTDGVLRLVLPKAEASKPREIAIKTK